MLQYEYYNVNLQQNTALKIKETVGVLTPPNGFAFGVLSALTNLETVSSEIIQNYNSVLINTLNIRVPTCDEMVAYTEVNFAKKQEVILKKEEMPSASADLVGAEYQYVGQDTTNYTHGYIYECRATENNTLTFDPNIMSCSWDDLSAFLSQQTSDYNSVVKGTLTYIDGGDLWRLVAMDAEDNVILSYQQYTGDWEAVGFTFTGTYEDGDVVSFERNTTATYAWVRVDVQPDLTSYIDSQISIVQADISDIEALIPAQASTSNKLADKNFVNSSISTNTANFVGTFNSVAELEAYSGTVTNNDYAFVIGTDSAGNTTYNRYKYNGNTQQWIYEYTLNNSSFTAAQWAAIQSGITAAKVSTYDGYAATIASKQDTISDLATIRAGAAAGATAVQPGDVGNGTITITQGGVTKGSFTLNQATGDTIALDAGGGGISNIDNITITTNTDDEIQAVATVNQNPAAGATNPVYDWVGTLAEYQAQNIETLHPDWICYIIDDVSGGDSVYTKAQVDEKFQEKATAVNYSYVSNCITEIPQDIKLELNNGTLTLKAGSKVFIPNGLEIFDEQTIVNDITLTETTNGQYMLFVQTSGLSIDFVSISNTVSGSTNPETTYTMWYNTTNNTINLFLDDPMTPTRTESLPVAIFTVSNGIISSIDQIFNGFGYIGSTIFALPGVQCLIPNGRNADGSLKNIEFTTDHVSTVTNTSNLTTVLWYSINANGNITNSLTDYWKYDEQKNLWVHGDVLWTDIPFARSYANGGKVENFVSKTAFHAVDYNDTEYIAHQATPSSRYIDLTLGASGSNYTAPADGYVYVSIQATNVKSFVYIGHREPETGFSITSHVGALPSNHELFLPVKKGQVFAVVTGYVGTVGFFRFIYANGAE